MTVPNDTTEQVDQHLATAPSSGPGTTTQAMKDAVILPAVYQKVLLYRNPAVTNAYVQAYYGMYNYAVMGVNS